MDDFLNSKFAKVIAVLLICLCLFLFWKSNGLNVIPQGDSLSDTVVPQGEVPVAALPQTIQSAAQSEPTQENRNEIAETDNCKTLPRFAFQAIKIPAFHLKRLHTNEGPVFRGGLPTNRCWYVGQKISLMIEVDSTTGSKFWVQSAEGEIQKLFNQNEAEVLIREFSLGMMPGLLAPTCEDYCDGIVEKLDTNNIATHRKLVFLPIADPRRPKLTSATFFEFDPQTAWAQKFIDSFEPIKDNSFVVMTDLPISLRGANLVSTMRLLKQKGAKQVLWFYNGVQSIDEGAVRPTLPTFAENVRFANLIESIQPGTQFIFATDAEGTNQHLSAFSSAMIVKSKWMNANFARPISDLDLNSFSTDEKIEFPKGVKLNPDLPVVVFGQSLWSWHPIFVLRNLHQKGFKKLYWMQGGNSEAMQWKVIEKINSPEASAE